MENIVMITLLTLTLFGKIEMHTFEIPGQNHYKHRWNGKKVIGYICGGHEPQ
jgi:hypothetical protein